jgi:hypothetical protein
MRDIVSEMIEVVEENQDDMGRIVGYYCYVGTKIWFEDGLVHRTDGPAVITLDGVDRYYIKGKEITVEARDFMIEHRWNPKKGLDRPDKIQAFQAAFCK